MEKNFRNITNLTNNKSQADRFKQIQHKLHIIAQNKSTQIKEQKFNSTNHRVFSLQKNANDFLRRVQSQIKEQKQCLRQLSREFQENDSRKQLSIKNRVTQINELQTKITNLIISEVQKSRQNETKNIMMYQQKLQSMRLEFLRQVEKRKQYFLVMDNQLSEKLPCLQNEISLKMQQSAQNLNRIQKQIQDETEKTCQQIKDAQTKQLSSFQQLMHMISSVIAQVKQQIAIEKQSRQINKKKLLALFKGASEKFST